MQKNLNKLAPPRFRPSFTLIELLVAIGIMGVLIGMVLVSLAGAKTDTQISLTKKTIEKINSIILEEWEAFRYRAARIDIDPDMLRPQKSSGQPLLQPRAGARLRMTVLRDLMRMEMPDRLSDLVYPPAIYSTQLSNGQTYSPAGRTVPGKYNNMRRMLNLRALNFGPYSGAVVPIYQNTGTSPPPAGFNFENESAEMLYLIVASATHAGGPALEAFRPSEVGDTDNDGLQEFLDAWGNPISWIRWPSGFNSPLNVPFNQDGNQGNPDAMDPLRTDPRWNGNTFRQQRPWLLVPLIVSAGPDFEFGLEFELSQGLRARVEQGQSDALVYAKNQDPYVGTYVSGSFNGMGLGHVTNSVTSADNVTNYNLILE